MLLSRHLVPLAAQPADPNAGAAAIRDTNWRVAVVTWLADLHLRFVQYLIRHLDIRWG